MQQFIAQPVDNVANIGEKERQKRLVMGIGVIVVSIGIGVGLAVTGISRWWRLSLFVPFFLGALGYFQAMEKT